MATLGQKQGDPESLDSAVAVSASGSANGSSKDIGANTSPQAVNVDAQFSLTQTGTTNSADFEVKVQHSNDNTNWPDNDQGEPVFSWKASSAGADLTRSEWVRFTPKRRYFRFRFTNNNATDSFTVDSSVALTTVQSA